jgi:hypothetical protein
MQQWFRFVKKDIPPKTTISFIATHGLPNIDYVAVCPIRPPFKKITGVKISIAGIRCEDLTSDTGLVVFSATPTLEEDVLNPVWIEVTNPSLTEELDVEVLVFWISSWVDNYLNDFHKFYSVKKSEKIKHMLFG